MVARQRDVGRVNATAASWNLNLNSTKCVVLRFCKGIVHGLHQYSYILNDNSLSSVDEHKDFRVIVDSKLRFHSHIRSTVQKAAELANSLIRSTINREAGFMMALFISHVRHKINFCSCVWNVGYLGDSRLLESVQLRWTK